MRGAVKVLHRICACDPDVSMRFRREGYIANKVGHPGAVRVLDDDVDDDGSPFLVMELLDGAPLHQRLATSPGVLTPREGMLVADQLLDLLVAAHDRGIVHRDLKPENLFLTVDGHVKVLDFGIAHLGETGDSRRDARAATMSGIAMGTPAYMAPEQARGRWDLVGPQSDLWSVGATLFTLLSGQCVHEEETTTETLAAAITKPARSLATVAPGVHPALVAVVDRALERKLADRWPDARAMHEALRAAYVASEGRLPPPLPGSKRISTDLPIPGARLSQGASTLSATSAQAAARARGRGAWLVSGLVVAMLASSIGLLAARGRANGKVAVRSFARSETTEEAAPSTPTPAPTSTSTSTPIMLVTSMPSSSVIAGPSAAAATITEPPRRVPSSMPSGGAGGFSARPPSIRSPIYDRRY
jgi:serine/threonine-protein kinase